jgi:hypothetical protein
MASGDVGRMDRRASTADPNVTATLSRFGLIRRRCSAMFSCSTSDEGESLWKCDYHGHCVVGVY